VPRRISHNTKGRFLLPLLLICSGTHAFKLCAIISLWAILGRLYAADAATVHEAAWQQSQHVTN